MPGITSFLFSCKVVVLEMSKIIYEEKQRSCARTVLKGKWLGKDG
jgi:hypothetical protein